MENSRTRTSYSFRSNCSSKGIVRLVCDCDDGIEIGRAYKNVVGGGRAVAEDLDDVTDDDDDDGGGGGLGWGAM